VIEGKEQNILQRTHDTIHGLWGSRRVIGETKQSMNRNFELYRSLNLN
jgi:hypothetical protein